MRFMPFAVSVVLLSATGVGCARLLPESKSLPAETWPDAIRLSNGEVELVVVPSIGRIMHFGLTGGENLLWINPKLLGLPVRDVKHWQDFGGDKAWVWPQARWNELSMTNWPPPKLLDPGRWSVERIGGHVVLVSDVDRELGLRIRRDIALVAGRPTARIVTVVERVGPRGAGFSTQPSSDAPFAAWVIAQIPTPDELLVPSNVSSSRPWVPMSARPDPRFVEAVSGGFRIHPMPSAQKAGFDASELAARFGELRLVQRIVGVSEGVYLEPTDRAQVYASEHGAPGKAEYVELEFTAPPGQRSELVVEWTVERAK